MLCVIVAPPSARGVTLHVTANRAPGGACRSAENDCGALSAVTWSGNEPRSGVFMTSFEPGAIGPSKVISTTLGFQTFHVDGSDQIAQTRAGEAVVVALSPYVAMALRTAPAAESPSY